MSKPKPNSFERLFERHMKGGNVSDFKRDYLTLYTFVIRPIERQRDQLLIDIAAHVDAEGMWERLMMELVGEDGPGSVRTAIEQLKLERDAYMQEVKTLRAKLSEKNADQSASEMTKREYFVGLAMQGFVSNTEWSKELTADDWNDYVARLTQGSVEVADALLAELEKSVTK